jgi:hypothetical protein
MYILYQGLIGPKPLPILSNYMYVYVCTVYVHVKGVLNSIPTLHAGGASHESH